MGLSIPVRNFLYVVIDHRRVRLLATMVDSLRSWLDATLGIARLSVVSAAPMNESLRGSVIQKFNLVTGKRVQARFEVDPSLLGGTVVRHGSMLYDGSLRAQLKALDRTLAAEG